MDWSKLSRAPEFCSAYTPPGITCGVWIGVVDAQEHAAWKVGEVSALTMYYPFSFHIQGQSVAIVPTFPVLETQESMEIMPFALQTLGNVIEKDGQYTCKGNYYKLFSDYSELILRVTADKANLVLASPADLSKIRKH